MIVMVPLISYYQLYLPCGRKRVFEEGSIAVLQTYYEITLIVMVPLIPYSQLYLPLRRKRVRTYHVVGRGFEEGYGRMFAERPTGSRASRQSASGGSSTQSQR